MSDYFDPRKESESIRKATRAFAEVLLEQMLPPMRIAAASCGYALAIHGSLSRDIDIVAIPWVENVGQPQELVTKLCGIISGFVGNCHPMTVWGEKPHGRKSITIVSEGMVPEIDLSIMPIICYDVPKEKDN